MKFDLSKEQMTKERQSMTVEEMAKAHDVSVTTMRRRLAEAGLTRTADRADINDEQVVVDFESGMTINEIAIKYHASHDTITKRLAKQGITCGRAEGIKKHFKRTYDERWDAIQKDLDAGVSMTDVRAKHHIRMDNLKMLMEQHGYLYSNDAMMQRLNKRINAAKAAVEMDARNRFELDYLLAIKGFIDANDDLPTRQDLCKSLDRAYTNVCQNIRKMNLGSFIKTNSANQESSYERRVEKRLNAEGIKFERNNRKVLDGKEVDFWLPDLNMAIEVNPVATHSVDSTIGKIDKNYHQQKSLLALHKGIALVHLYEQDFEGNQFNKIFEFIAKHNVDKTFVGARKCELRSCEENEYHSFVKQWHIQGDERNSVYKFGLYHQDELVSVMSVAKYRFGRNDMDAWEIVRYCVRPDIGVSGGFSRLLSACSWQIGTGSQIISYMDLNKRFSAENVYEKNGFEVDIATEPDYVWVHKDNHGVLKRYQTMKSKLVAQGFDGSKTEVEIMHGRGFWKVYGAGSIRYMKKI